MLYILIIPPWQSGDAPGHFEFVALTAEWQRLPTIDETWPSLTREINASAQSQCAECFGNGRIDIDYLSRADPPLLLGPREVDYQPPLYYILLAPLYAALRGQSILVHYYALVFISGLMAVATVFLAGLTAQTLFPSDRLLQIAIPAFALFCPTQSFLAAAINNDNLATLISALGMLLLVWLFRYGFRWTTALGLLAVAVIGVLTKRSLLFWAPLAIMGLGLYWVTLNLKRLTDRQRVVMSGVIQGVIVALIVAVPLSFFWPQLAGWLAWGLEKAPIAKVRGVGFVYQAIASGTYWTPKILEIDRQSAVYTLITSWALFGWGNLWPAAGYTIISVVIGLACLGLMAVIWRSAKDSQRLEPWQKNILGVFALSIVLAFAGILVVIVGLGVPGTWTWPGRYLQTLLIPFGVFLALGLKELFPRAKQPWFLYMLLGGLFLSDAVSLAQTAIPFFYGIWGLKP